MNLEALLSELRGNVLRDDAELASGPDDKLWSDETLVRYINDAMQRFARKTLLLRDASTPEVVEVTLATGVSTYDLHESVLAVVSAVYEDEQVDLARTGRALLSTRGVADSLWFDANDPAVLTPGKPRVFATDETLVVDTKGGVHMRIWPAPTADEDGTTIFMKVARLPLVPFDVNKPTAECEIHDMYVLDMLAWAAYRAFSNSDIDGHSTAADKYEARFEKSIEEAQRDVRRKMRAPIGWTFGQNGFAWGDN
jgi:hypothetical protein